MKPRTIEESEAFIAKNLKLADSPTWPFVLEFAERMESKLEKNRHKGDREGWLNCPVENLLEALLDETVEVQQAYTKGNAEYMANECADVANFCMMVADWYIEKARLHKATRGASHPIPNSPVDLRGAGRFA